MDLAKERKHMVEWQLAARGISDPRVLNAFLQVPREAFLPGNLRESAYDDNALPIGDGQTISQPYIVALTIEALHIGPNDRVLEIGTGSGYAAALLSQIAKQVYSVERIEALATLASERLKALGLNNVTVLCGDGTLGWPEYAPFNGIAVAAGGPEAPQALQEQLAPNGRLVIPIGSQHEQLLTRITREAPDRFRSENLAGVHFVPLIGAQGWPTSPLSGPSASTK